MRSLIISTLIALIPTIFLIVKLKDRKFWDREAYYKFPTLLVLYIVVISIPQLLGFSNDIHTPYSIFYVLVVNFPILYFVDIDKLEVIFFGKQTLRTSNLTFAIASIIFWAIISVFAGVILFIKNIYKESHST